MEDSEGHVNAYKVWNISHNCSNSVTLVRLCHDSLTSGTQPERNRNVTGTQLRWVHVDVRAGTHGSLSL